MIPDPVHTPSMRFMTSSKADQECVKDGNFERCRQSGEEVDDEGQDGENVRTGGGGEYEEVGRENVVRETSLTEEDFYSVSVHGMNSSSATLKLGTLLESSLKKDQKL